MIAGDWLLFLFITILCLLYYILFHPISDPWSDSIPLGLFCDLLWPVVIHRVFELKFCGRLRLFSIS